MKKSARLILFTTLCAALALVFTPGRSARGVAADTATPRERHFELEYKATVKDVPAGAKKVELWIPIPHDSPSQMITGTRIECTYREQDQKTQNVSRDQPIGD